MVVVVLENFMYIKNMDKKKHKKDLEWIYM